jgi:molybdate transport system ATP-binding protein
MTAHKSFFATTILVSHDIDEISRLTDKVYVIDNGKIINGGKPEIVFASKETGNGLSVNGKIISVRGNELTININEGQNHNLRNKDSIKIMPS